MNSNTITFPGLRVIDSGQAPEFETAARQSGGEIRFMDLGETETCEDLVDALGVALSFPSYFGKNWDAVEECIEGMEWLVGRPLTLFIRNSDRLLHLECIDVMIFVRTLARASTYWKERRGTFETVLVGGKQLLLTVAQIMKPPFP